jgi:3',5'-cyclic-AMP phosphodiesterase
MPLPIQHIPFEADCPIHVVQLSDPHLFVDRKGCLLGMNTENSFQEVLTLVGQQQSKIDLVLATGDIAQAPALETYARFYQSVARFEAPQYWLQGNHDIDHLFEDHQHREPCTGPTILAIGAWRVIMLNSSVDHEVAGEFNPSELVWLEDALETCRGHYTIVALHHHPVPVGSFWLDQHMLTNTLPFWQLLDRFPDVKTVIHGHVHQQVDVQYGRVRVLACPSTCIQFKPKSHDFALDALPPGYRWLTLYPDGQIDTAVCRINRVPSGVDFASLGY